jgi:hydrogenase expression/formation protein HypD
VVTLDGNKKAKKITQHVFKRVDVDWRGLGIIPKSGLAVRDEFHAFDAQKSFDVVVPDSKDPEACACGDILSGTKIPSECPLYQRICTPTEPVGPCMVSSEGTCAAYYKYHAM